MAGIGFYVGLGVLVVVLIGVIALAYWLISSTTCNDQSGARQNMPLISAILINIAALAIPIIILVPFLFH